VHALLDHVRPVRLHVGGSLPHLAELRLLTKILQLILVHGGGVRLLGGDLKRDPDEFVQALRGRQTLYQDQAVPVLDVFEEAHEDLLDDGVLRLEMVIQAAGLHADRVADVAHGGRADAAFREHPRGAGKDQCPPVLFRVISHRTRLPYQALAQLAPFERKLHATRLTPAAC